MRKAGLLFIDIVGLLLCLAWGVAAAGANESQTAVPAAASAPAPDPSFHFDLKEAVTYLASDELQGRRVGTPGSDKAAAFVANTFSKLGLQTLSGFNGYFQPFEMITRVDPDPQQTSLSIDRHALELGKDYSVFHASAEKAASGPIVFAGYGITDPAHHYDDYAGIDAKGKIVLAMRYEPVSADGSSRLANVKDDWSLDATIPQKVQTAIDHGAIGVLLVNPPLHHDDDPALLPFSRYVLGVKLPLMQINVDQADKLLKPIGADLKKLQSEIDQSLKPASAAIPNSDARMAFAMKVTKAQVENVAALLPGKGEHADEYIVVGAHYDHLGLGGPGSMVPWVRGIHHGADDNASGTSAVLELAERFSRLGPQPRSIIFIAFTGEEEGLIGSKHFVNHCPVPLEKIVAMLNLDMVGRVRGEALLIGGAGTAPAFEPLLQSADKDSPLKLGTFTKGGYGPSDHMAFAQKKIPVLFLFSGIHQDYHRPTDTSDKINYQGIDQVVDFSQKLIDGMTRLPRQKYNDSYDAQPMVKMLAGPTTREHGQEASLGTIPDYSQPDDSKEGMRVGGIVPHSPADKLALREGDLIVEFNGTPIGNKMDYTVALGKARPGQTVKVKVRRADKVMELEATLGVRGG